jgi:N-acylneuraminate cytidylyltransferase
MSIIAIIPARGGSKGIKNKNIIDLNGKPLIYYTLNTLLNTPKIDRVAVSTDDTKIISAIRDLFGAMIDIIQRPTEISGDTTPSEPVISHALENNQNYEHILFAQCTSPLTEEKDFTALIQKIEEGYDSTAFYINDYSFFFDIDDQEIRSIRKPRQERKPRKREVGNGWAFSIQGFLKHKCRLFGRIGLCEIQPPKHLEIDTPEDLNLIKIILRGPNG